MLRRLASLGPARTVAVGGDVSRVGGTIIDGSNDAIVFNVRVLCN